MKKEIEICENCVYFIRHYIKSYNRFKRLDSGHCPRKRVKWIRIDGVCDNFTRIDKAANDEKQVLCIKHLLEKISKELYEIKQVLKDV